MATHQVVPAAASPPPDQLERPNAPTPEQTNHWLQAGFFRYCFPWVANFCVADLLQEVETLLGRCQNFRPMPFFVVILLGLLVFGLVGWLRKCNILIPSAFFYKRGNQRNSKITSTLAQGLEAQVTPPEGVHRTAGCISPRDESSTRMRPRSPTPTKMLAWGEEEDTPSCSNRALCLGADIVCFWSNKVEYLWMLFWFMV